MQAPRFLYSQNTQNCGIASHPYALTHPAHIHLSAHPPLDPPIDALMLPSMHEIISPRAQSFKVCFDHTSFPAPSRTCVRAFVLLQANKFEPSAFNKASEKIQAGTKDENQFRILKYWALHDEKHSCGLQVTCTDRRVKGWACSWHGGDKECLQTSGGEINWKAAIRKSITT